MGTRHISIIGAGLVGSLMAVYMRNRGYDVSVFERRPDFRKTRIDGGRSINLALSNRGIRALKEVGAADIVQRLAIPMHGRMMHAVDGKLTFQRYGREGQYINSISRANLNLSLIELAERHGVNFKFDHRVSKVNFEDSVITFEAGSTSFERAFDGIIGADGAFSATRLSMQFTDRYNFSQDYIHHGYKEFEIPPGPFNQFLMEKNALHIWPRESFMLIALPNIEGSFTCTLFFPFEGDLSFQSLNSDQRVTDLFAKHFPDALDLMPNVLDDFKTNPTSSLVTIKCFPWVRNNTLLIGDAAHAIVPFYGQGMNAGFEDCRILDEMLTSYSDDWGKAITAFQKERKPDTDAIAELALDNFVEMRDLVADEEFLLRKKIEARLHDLYPDEWIPLYSMVTFYDSIRYSEAQRIGARQKSIMDEVMRKLDIAATWEHLDFEQLVQKLQGV
jgi:kynurenine 3-monooxygenase